MIGKGSRQNKPIHSFRDEYNFIRKETIPKTSAKNIKGL